MIRVFIKSLYSGKYELTKQEVLTLRGQALSGDMAGAQRGLLTLQKRHANMRMQCAAKMCIDEPTSERSK